MALVNVPKKSRRDSLRGLAGQSAFKLVATCSGVGSYLETNADIADILIRLTKSPSLAVLSPENMKEDFELLLDFGDEVWDCVGIMISIDYRSPTGRLRHAKPYIKIGTDWFDGDNKLGYLKKLHMVPRVDMVHKISNVPFPDGEIVKASLFYKERRLLSERLGTSWVGKPTFGQLGTSCGPDALLSILMYADGFYEIFNQGYYQSIKPFIGARFNYNSVKAEPYTAEELKDAHDKLLPLLTMKHEGTLNIKDGERVVFSYNTKHVNDARSFLIYSFIRFYTIETMTIRNYNVPDNASGGKRKTRRKRKNVYKYFT